MKELEKAVAKLSPEEVAKFREWFHAFEQDEWDRQITHDATSGKLDKFAEEAIINYKARRAKEL